MTNIRKTLKRDLHVTTKYATPQRVLVVGFVTVLTIHDHIPSLLEILCKIIPGHVHSEYNATLIHHNIILRT